MNFERAGRPITAIYSIVVPKALPVRTRDSLPNFDVHIRWSSPIFLCKREAAASLVEQTPNHQPRVDQFAPRQK